MRERLIQYVELLFAGAPDSEEIKMEILQNTLDRYDDLISQGKSPDAAYRLSIAGIGDVNEILGNGSDYIPHAEAVKQEVHKEAEDIQSRKMHAAAVAMYILCAVPLFILSDFGYDTIGLCLTLLMVAGATVLMILSKKQSTAKPARDHMTNPHKELRKSISSVIWAVGLAAYFILSFATGAWHITWIIFLIIKCVQSLAWAIVDLKEAVESEN